jgi:hypothetical protein
MEKSTNDIELTDGDEFLDDEFEVVEEIGNTAIEYISAAYYALDAAESANMMTKDGQVRMNRIKRKCLRIIDHCVSELYDELFDDNDDQA